MSAGASTETSTLSGLGSLTKKVKQISATLRFFEEARGGLLRSLNDKDTDFERIKELYQNLHDQYRPLSELADSIQRKRHLISGLSEAQKTTINDSLTQCYQSRTVLNYFYQYYEYKRLSTTFIPLLVDTLSADAKKRETNLSKLRERYTELEAQLAKIRSIAYAPLNDGIALRLIESQLQQYQALLHDLERYLEIKYRIINQFDELSEQAILVDSAFYRLQAVNSYLTSYLEDFLKHHTMTSGFTQLYEAVTKSFGLKHEILERASIFKELYTHEQGKALFHQAIFDPSINIMELYRAYIQYIKIIDSFNSTERNKIALLHCPAASATGERPLPSLTRQKSEARLQTYDLLLASTKEQFYVSLIRYDIKALYGIYQELLKKIILQASTEPDQKIYYSNLEAALNKIGDILETPQLTHTRRQEIFLDFLATLDKTLISSNEALKELIELINIYLEALVRNNPTACFAMPSSDFNATPSNASASNAEPLTWWRPWRSSSTPSESACGGAGGPTSSRGSSTDATAP